MKIIANMAALGCGYGDMVSLEAIEAYIKEYGKEALLVEIFESIRSQFNEQDQSDVCLYLPGTDEMGKDIILGADSPTEVIKTAEKWNQVITNELRRAVETVSYEFSEGTALREMHTYNLSCAARMAYGTWFPFSEYATYVASEQIQYPRFGVLLDDKVVKEVRAHPEQFVLATVYPK